LFNVGKRPISGVNDDSVVVSPADAVVNMIDDNLFIETPVNVKTQKLNVAQLLNNSEFAKNFEAGTAVSCILMPTVYHRYHAPVSGIVVESDEDIAGNYFGIDDFPKLINGGNVGYGYNYSVFEHFRRGYVIIKTEKCGYPIGSGGIESANKFICHTRMKRSGAWWVKETGNEMLGIRCAIYNGTYDNVFEKYKKAQIPL